MTKMGTALMIALGSGVLFSLHSSAIGAPAEAPINAVNRYQSIVDRNVFGLKAPPPPPDPEMNKPPPPKITPTGITTIIGKKALFKVQLPARPPKPAEEKSFMLGEGQREEQIEVLEIDENAGSIKFNNNGTVMVLTLEKDGAKLPNTPPPAVPAPANPAIPGAQAVGYTAPTVNPVTGQHSGGATVTTIGGNPGLKSIPTRTLRLPNTPGGAAPYSGNPVGNVQPQAARTADLSPEEQMIIIEAQREHAKTTGDPISKILPPTPLSPPANNPPTPPLPQ